MSDTNQPTIAGADEVQSEPQPASASVAGMGAVAAKAKKASSARRPAAPKRKAEARLVEENDGALFVELWVTGRRTTLDVDEAEILGGNLIARANTANRIIRERNNEDF